MIDAHVHLRDGLQKEKETLAHGLSIASLCGMDMVFDMPNCNPALISQESIEDRLALAEKAIAHVKDETGRQIAYGLYAGLTGEPQQIGDVVKTYKALFPQVVGLKLFAGNSTGNMGQVTMEQQRFIYQNLVKQDYRGVLAVHCEKESLFHPELEDGKDFSSHSLARPIEAEVASIRDQIQLAKETDFQGSLHICHVSSVQSLEVIEKARMEGVKITCGATAHHLLLSSEDAAFPELYAKVNPPLRDKKESSRLFQALLDGRIDWVESDHAPHTLEDKRKGASGIIGFSGTLLLLDRLYQMQVPRKTLLGLFGLHVQQTFAIPLFPLTLVEPSVCKELSDIVASCYPYDSYAMIR
ncbi:MAG: dihydroorotase [Sphaerochaetaceae bacterium]